MGGTARLWRYLASVPGAALRRRAQEGSLTAARVELASTNPAKKYGLFSRKGAIAVGSDADLALCDLEKTQEVNVEESHSAQDHNPFAGFPITGWPVTTILRGNVVFRDGEVLGGPQGQYLKRPVV